MASPPEGAIPFAPLVPPSAKEPGALTALVFGASGITGHAILASLLSYPSPRTFTRVIGLTNRPLSADIAQLPTDGRIELYSGINLLEREKSLLQLQHVPGVNLVTHVFYAAYGGHGLGFDELKKVNAEMLTNAVGGVEICCPNLQFITLNTGGKAYGVEFVGESGIDFSPPLLESSPRIPSPHAEKIFYYAQHDILRNASAGKRWSFCEIRPDVIVGFVPNGNAMNMAAALGLYFSLYKAVEGEGAEVAFPYGAEAWEALHTDSSSDLLARFHIYCATHPEAVAGQAFNCVDSAPFTWSALWPRLAAFFGLKGIGPGTGKPGDSVLGTWIHAHAETYPGFVQKYNLRPGVLESITWKFADDVCGIPFRRDMSSEKRKAVGFMEERDAVEGFERAFQEMRKGGIIP